MKIAGEITDNLRYAIQSATRLRRHPVHSDTLQHWQALLALGRRKARQSSPVDRAELEGQIERLETLLAER